MTEYTPSGDSQHVLKAEAFEPDATDRENPPIASPMRGGALGTGQPAAAGPLETCAACRTAEANPLTGLVVDGCRGCAVRRLSNSPRWQQEDFLNTFVDSAERDGMRAAMSAECQRRKAFEGRALV